MTENRNNSVISLILRLSQKSIIMCSFETLFFILLIINGVKKDK